MTNIKKRSLAIIMAILVGIMFTIPSLPANAVTKTGVGSFNDKPKKGKSGGYYKSSALYNTGNLTYYNVGGTTCLCLDKSKAFGNGNTYKRKSVNSIKYKGNQDKWLKRVLRFSYGSKAEPPYGNKADKFAASQMIIWQLGAKEIGGNKDKLGTHKSGSYYNILKGHKYGLKNYDWIIKRVNQWVKGPSFNGKTYTIGEKTVYSITDYNSYRKYEVESKKNISEVKISRNSKDLYVYKITLKNGKNLGKLTLVDKDTKKTGAWYVYKVGPYQTVSANAPSDSKTYSVAIKKNPDKYEQSLKITKTDAETNQIVNKAGFKFQIKKKSDGSLWRDPDSGATSFITNNSGIAHVDPFEPCAAGKWQIVETGVPEADDDEIQYAINPNPVDVPAVASNQDVEMTVEFANYPAPDIETSAYDKATTTHLGTISKNCTIIDKVTCTSLLKGKEYTINGVLVDKESGKDIEETNQSVTFTIPNESGPITDKTGNEIGEAVFEENKPSEATIYMTYTFDSSAYAGKETVVAETLVPKDGKPIIHRDLEDTEQTILFPKIGTRAFDLVTESNVGSVSKNETIKDIISFHNLIAGKEYTAIGKIIDKETGDVLAEKEAKFNVNDDGSTDVDEEEASEINFNIVYKPNSAYEEVDGKLRPVEGAQGSGSDVTQEINAEEEKQKEEADEDTSNLYTFGDDDSAENLSGCHFGAPEGYVFDGWNTEPDGSGTSYSPGRSVSSLNAEEGATVNLYAQYIESGENEDDESGEEGGDDAIEEEGVDEEEIPNPDVTPQKFVNGEIEMTFDGFDSSKLQGKQIVVFEVVKYNDNEIAKHEEIDSEEQTITYPSVHTNALDKATNEHVPVLDKKQTIVDTVTYTGLTPDKEYTLKGKLMDKKTGKPFLENGKEVTNEIKFTPEEPDGEIQLEFEVDATALAKKTLVVFEDILLEDNPVVAHADIEDEDQSVHYPEIGTKAADVKTKDEVGTTINKTTLSDTVSYKNLIAGKEYDVRGVLMDKETNKPIVGKDGEQITGHAKFTPEGEGAVSGTVNVVFEFDSDIVKGKSTVVFEDLYLGEHKVATHSDINDKDQTVHYNELKTTATVDSKHDVESNNYVVINDKVMYKNLVPGKKYTVKGVLMDKGTKKPVVQNGKKVTASKTFTAKKKNGFVVLNFRVNAGAIGNKTTVAFEDLYHNKVKIGTHSDINDNAQTVKFKKPPIPPVQSGDTGLPWWIFAIIAGLAVVAGGAVIYKKRR